MIGRLTISIVATLNAFTLTILTSTITTALKIFTAIPLTFSIIVALIICAIIVLGDSGYYFRSTNVADAISLT